MEQSKRHRQAHVLECPRMSSTVSRINEGISKLVWHFIRYDTHQITTASFGFRCNSQVLRCARLFRTAGGARVQGGRWAMGNVLVHIYIYSSLTMIWLFLCNTLHLA